MLSKFNKTRKLMIHLEQEKYSYPNIFENSSDILLFIVDMKGKVVKIRGDYNGLIGIENKEIIRKKYLDLVYEKDLDKVTKHFKEVLNGTAQYVEHRIMSMSGALFHMGVTLIPIQVDNNEVIGFYGLTYNGTQKKELNNRIQRTQEKLQSLIQHSHDIIGILDSEGTFVFGSPSVESILGYKVEEITGEPCFNLIHSDDLQLAKRKFDEILNRPNTPISIEARLRHSSGEWRDFEISCTNLLDNVNIMGIICNFRNITERKKQQLEIQYMAYHDFLTELPNRRAFEDKLNLEIRLGKIDKRKFAVLFINLDGFKFLNNSVGYDIGDLLLIEIARKIKNSFSEYIEMLARIDGDEFAILTTNLHDVASIEKITKEILNIFEKPFGIKDYNLFITASIGISIYPESGEDADTLIKNTNLALYLARKGCNNNYQIFSPTANVATYKTFSLRNDLQNALRDNQFIVHYEPIIHTETKKIISVEALLHWDHPDWGIVSPEEFIPLAEESGLIIQINDWVLLKVCKDLHLWHSSGYFIKAAVNLSPVQFYQTDLVEGIRNILHDNELDPKWLNIEITESTTVEQEENMLGKIKQLQELGVQITIDHFGTGYASLRSLKEMNPDILKLDSSFIKELPSDNSSVEIVASIIDLAKRLGIGVVADGVETKEQHNFLLGIECDWVQGFIFSRPLSGVDLKKLLKGQWDEAYESSITEERRNYFRIDFQYPLEAFMTVAELNGKKVQVRNTKILLNNIGPGGLSFLSNIKLPSTADITLKIQTAILQEEFTFYGTIMHDTELGNIYNYGVKFIIDEKRREHLIKHFNQFQLLLKKNPLLENHTFVIEKPTDYFSRL